MKVISINNRDSANSWTVRPLIGVISLFTYSYCYKGFFYFLYESIFFERLTDIINEVYKLVLKLIKLPHFWPKSLLPNLNNRLMFTTRLIILSSNKDGGNCFNNFKNRSMFIFIIIIRIVQKNSSTFQFQTFDFQFKFK